MQSSASGSVAVPVLNRYILSTTRKEEVPGFLVLSRELVACAESPDEKQLRHLQQTVLTRLPYFEALPVVVLPPLFTIAKQASQNLRKDHKKLLRLLYYQLHVLLSCGRAGTSGTKDVDETVSAALLPPHVLKEYWQMFSQPTKDIAQIVAFLHLLAGILRGIRTSTQKSKQKTQQERAVLTGKFVATVSGILSSEYQPPRGDKKGIFKISSKTTDEEEAKALIRKAALVCIRASLPIKEQRKLVPNAFNVLKNHEALDGVSMRHILALASESCQKSTSVFVQEIKFRLEATMEVYGPTGYLFPVHDGVGSKPEAPNGSSPPLPLTDPFSRKYLAQACGIVIKEMEKKAKGSVFWNAVVFLACGDPNMMVSFEAMRCLLGSIQANTVDILSKTKPAIEFEVDTDREWRERDACLIAWQNLFKEEVPAVLLTDEVQRGSKKRTLLSRCIARLHTTLTEGSHSMIAGALRVACELGRCYAYAFSERTNQRMWRRSSNMLNPLRDEILRVATNPNPYSSTVQYLSLKALIWLQGVDGGPLTPSVITRILSNGPCWSEELMSDILQTLFHRLIVQSSMSSYILDCVNAVIAGNPANTVPVQLVDFWFYSVEHSDKAKVLNAALEFLEAPRPPRAGFSAGGDLGAIAETCSAWRKLKKTVALWLGNAVVFLTEENPWQERDAISHAMHEDMSSTDLIAAEVTQNPLLMSTVSHFVHDLMTGLWETRLAAAKALTCIAIQCQEPYRIQIYGVFKGIVSGPDADVFGIRSTLTTVIEILDQMYSGQLIIDECISQWGGNFSLWPPEMAESVRNRHTLLLEEILSHCQVPTDLFFPLGPKSRALILGENVPVATMETQSSMPFEPPQAQYSEHLRQGSMYLEQGYYDQEQPDDRGFEDEHYESEHQEEDQVDQFLRGSQRTRDYMNTPSLKELVAQTPEVAAHSGEQTPTYADGTYEQGLTPTSEAEADVSEGKGHAADVEVAESPNFYQDPSSPSQGEPWETSSNAQGSYRSPSQERRGSTTSFDMENPFNQGLQSFEVPFESSRPVQIQEGFPKRAAVLFDFEAEMEGELTVNIGDIIHVLSEIEGGWYFASLTNVLGIKNEGIVPCDYVELQED